MLHGRCYYGYCCSYQHAHHSSSYYCYIITVIIIINIIILSLYVTGHGFILMTAALANGSKSPLANLVLAKAIQVAMEAGHLFVTRQTSRDLGFRV